MSSTRSKSRNAKLSKAQLADFRMQTKKLGIWLIICAVSALGLTVGTMGISACLAILLFHWSSTYRRALAPSASLEMTSRIALVLFAVILIVFPILLSIPFNGSDMSVGFAIFGLSAFLFPPFFIIALVCAPLFVISSIFCLAGCIRIVTLQKTNRRLSAREKNALAKLPQASLSKLGITLIIFSLMLLLTQILSTVRGPIANVQVGFPISIFTTPVWAEIIMLMILGIFTINRSKQKTTILSLMIANLIVGLLTTLHVSGMFILEMQQIIANMAAQTALLTIFIAMCATISLTLGITSIVACAKHVTKLTQQ